MRVPTEDRKMVAQYHRLAEARLVKEWITAWRSVVLSVSPNVLDQTTGCGVMDVNY